MIDEEMPDLVVAFHEDISSSRGTRDMIRRSQKHGIKFLVIHDVV